MMIDIKREGHENQQEGRLKHEFGIARTFVNGIEETG